MAEWIPNNKYPSVETIQSYNAKRPMPGVKLDIDKIEKLIKKHNGCLVYVSDELGCNRSALAHVINRHPHLQQALDDARQSAIDIVERVYMEKAMQGDSYNGTFLLRTLGRARGYDVEAKQENVLLKQVLEFVMDKSKNPAHSLVSGYSKQSLSHTSLEPQSEQTPSTL